LPRLARGGVTIHYEVHGSRSERTPLFLSHGYSASCAMWKPNLAELGADRQVITWDMRGHGYSDSPKDPSRYSEQACVEDMAAILDACGVKRAAIGGLSLGGYLSLAFNVAHPGRVTALLLFDTGPGFKQEASRELWNRQAAAYAEAFELKGMRAIAGGPEVGRGPHTPAGLALAARGILAQSDASVIESLPGIAVPTLVLVGENDEPFLLATDYMASKIPGATKVVMRNAGHASNIDQPHAFNETVVGFLRRVDSR
jgi:pimeloyl-ACP methyl ester carboxylesterase